MSRAACIEELRVDPEDPGLVHLRVGDAWIGPVRRDTAQAMRLAEGRRWTAAIAGKVQAEVAALACRADALRRLGRRDLTRALRAARLATRWGEAAAERAVSELAAAGWLDDRAYASRRAEQLQDRSPVAPELLQARLEQEGVTERDARRAAESAFDPAALHRQVLAWKREGRDGGWMARRLGRQGFDLDTIAAALQKARVPCDFDT